MFMKKQKHANNGATYVWIQGIISFHSWGEIRHVNTLKDLEDSLNKDITPTSDGESIPSIILIANYQSKHY